MNHEKMFSVLNDSVEREFNASETMQWLNLRPLWLGSWAFRELRTYQNKGLFFRVSGFHHNGYVLITLGWDDTYTVRLISTQWNVKKVITNVYCDSLAETIDINVERVAAYDK